MKLNIPSKKRTLYKFHHKEQDCEHFHEKELLHVNINMEHPRATLKRSAKLVAKTKLFLQKVTDFPTYE